MSWLIIPLVIIAAGMVLFSLARGLIYFSQTRGTMNGTGPENLHMLQNKMMFARVKWQAITIVLLVILMAVAGTR